MFLGDLVVRIIPTANDTVDNCMQEILRPSRVQDVRQKYRQKSRFCRLHDEQERESEIKSAGERNNFVETLASYGKGHQRHLTNWWGCINEFLEVFTLSTLAQMGLHGLTDLNQF